MDDFFQRQSSNDRLVRKYGVGTSSWNTNDVTSEHIEKKKKIVADLMALRRMKLMQQQKSSTSLALEGPTSEISHSKIDSSDVKPLLESTLLKEELDQLYGDAAINKATEHFATLSSNLQRPDSREDVDVQRKQFLNKITEKRRNQFEEDRQHRTVKQQNLIDKHVQLKQKEKSIDPTLPIASSGNAKDLPMLVDLTKNKLKTMEQNLRFLKLNLAKDISSQRSVAYQRSAAFEQYLVSHSKQVEIAAWIIDVILERVDDQCATNESNALDSQIFEMLLIADRQQYEEMQTKNIKSDAILAILNELVEEVGGVLISNLCEECVYLARMAYAYSEEIIIESCHVAVVGSDKIKMKKPQAKVVDESFISIRANRDRLRSGLWNHTLPTIREDVPALPQLPGNIKEATPPAPTVVDSGADLDVVSSENSVLKVDSQFGRSFELRRFSAYESDFWKNMVLDTPDYSFSPKPTIGVSVSCLTSDHSLFAVGSYRGDVLVYNMGWQPPRLMRCVSYAGKTNDAIIYLQWSLDNSRIITLSSEGCVIVWSVAYAPFVSLHDINALDMPHGPYNSQQLTAMCILETAMEDFLFKEGSLSENTKGISYPSIVTFHPTLSLTGAQNSIVVGLKNGDILKCSLSSNLQHRCQYDLMADLPQQTVETLFVLGSSDVERCHKIGQGMEAELFRHHRNEILQICFVTNGGDMISLDSSSNLCQWKCTAENFNSFGWFVPFKKYKLSFVEEILIEKGADDVLFEDIIALKKAAKGKKTKSKQVIEQERRRALRELQNLNIDNQKPWYTDEFPDELEDHVKVKKPPKFITRIYAPSDEHMIETAAGGASFVVVTIKRNGGTLVKYALRTYESVHRPAVSVLRDAVSSSGDRMYFMLLFDEHLPKVRKHVTIMDLHLEEMQLGKIGRIQINISADNFTSCREGGSANFSVSRVDQITGTEYVVCNICGNMQAYSLLSGKQILYKAPDKANVVQEVDGLCLPPRISKLNMGSRVVFVKPDSDTSYIVVLPLLLNKSSVMTRLIRIMDNSTPEKRFLLQSSYKDLLYLKKELRKSSEESVDVGWYNSEQACLREHWTCRHMPTSLYMELMLNTAVDVAIARSTGIRIPQDSRKKIWKKDWIKMQEYFAKLNE